MLHALLIFTSTQAGVNALVVPAPVEQVSVVHTKNRLTRLSNSEVQLHMQQLPDWTTDGQSLFHTRTFENFVEAIDFVNSLVDPAEKLAHHPDITVNYNQVSLELTTHDAGGLTELDFQLATTISQL
ncbi:MAG: 4a-hydroxytetrahydrobiopterin dehydratase [Cyanobacteria bacterium P01_D01_bin.156]